MYMNRHFTQNKESDPCEGLPSHRGTKERTEAEKDCEDVPIIYCVHLLKLRYSILGENVGFEGVKAAISKPWCVGWIQLPPESVPLLNRAYHSTGSLVPLFTPKCLETLPEPVNAAGFVHGFLGTGGWLGHCLRAIGGAEKQNSKLLFCLERASWDTAVSSLEQLI